MLTKFIEYCNRFVTILLSALLSRGCSTPGKRLQHSCQDIAALLSALKSRDYSTPVSKMLEYLNFFLLCTLFALLYYMYIRMKRCLTLLKMAENNLVSFDFDAPQSDSKRQKLLKCVLMGNSKLYLSKVYTKE